MYSFPRLTCVQIKRQNKISLSRKKFKQLLTPKNDRYFAVWLKSTIKVYFFKKFSLNHQNLNDAFNVLELISWQRNWHLDDLQKNPLGIERIVIPTIEQLLTFYNNVVFLWMNKKNEVFKHFLNGILLELIHK